MALPPSIIAASEHEIVAEDIILELLRRRLPGMRFTSLIEQDRPPPFVLIRKALFGNQHRGDERFIDSFYFTAHVFCEGLDADAEAPLVIAAISNELKIAALTHDEVKDGLGWVASTRVVEQARRRSDYADSEGPVQFADLPQGWVRYTAIFHLQIKRAHVGPNIYNV